MAVLSEAAEAAWAVDDEEEVSEEEREERWAAQYSSFHSILLVGEGDFSFSLALATAFGSAANIVATSLDSYDALLKKYSKAQSNLETLKKMEAMILHGVDATKMKLHTDLRMRKFDRIVFNFPHAGFKGKEDHPHLINLHRELVTGFFRNASHMLRPYGEVHVSHKTGGPFKLWSLEFLAFKNSLVLVETEDFRIEDYPGYNNKRGDGRNSDKPFPLGACSTFKFQLRDLHKRKRAPRDEFASHSSAYNESMPNHACAVPRDAFASHSYIKSVQHPSPPVPRAEFASHFYFERIQDGAPAVSQISYGTQMTRSDFPINPPSTNFNLWAPEHQMVRCGASLQGPVGGPYPSYYNGAPGSALMHCIDYLQRLHHESALRQERLRVMLVYGQSQ